MGYTAAEEPAIEDPRHPPKRASGIWPGRRLFSRSRSLGVANESGQPESTRAVESREAIGRRIGFSLASSLWAAALGIAFVPVYLRYLGIEAYGLIGLFATLQSVASLLDLGLTATMNREMARRAESQSGVTPVEDTICTLERVYGLIGLAIGLALFALAPVVATEWLTTAELQTGSVRNALRMSALVLTLQWPFGLYVGGLTGLHRQNLVSGLNASVAALRGAGAVAVLAWVSPTLWAFFLWQAAVSLVSTLWARTALLRAAVPSRRKGVFDAGQIRRVGRFAGGVTIVSALGLVLVQTDKVVLSRMLRLDEFGDYALSGAVALSLFRLAAPVFSVVSPLLAAAVAGGDEVRVRGLYHDGAKALSIVLIPATVVLALFARETLFVWTGDIALAGRLHGLVALTTIGYGLHGLMHVPWALQLAHGWTRLAAWLNGASILLSVPLVVILTPRLGAMGGAIAWLVVNSVYLPLGLVMTHRRLLPGATRGWFVSDTGAPLACALAVALAARTLDYATLGRTGVAAALCIISCATLGAAALSLNPVRRWLAQRVRTRPPGGREGLSP